MLVEACLQGDRSAFDDLVDRYQRPLFAATYRITGSVDDAMDATQNAFVKAYEKLHTFDGSHRFFSWVYRIAINQALNLVDAGSRLHPFDQQTPVAEPSPEAAAGTMENRQHLQRAMVELPPHYRTVLVLKHLEGLSYREIAEILEIPEKTVKSRLFTARRRLREILVERGFAL